MVFYMVMWQHFGYYASNPISGINYFAYFTFLANFALFSWFVLMGLAILFGIGKLKRFLIKPVIFCGVMLYIILVGIIFYGILRWQLVPFPWYLWYARLSDFFMHAIAPTSAILLFVYIKKTRVQNGNQTALTFKHALLWLVFPLVYFVFSMARGLVIDWFPYPFFDPNWDFIYNIPLPAWLALTSIALVFCLIFYLAGILTIKIWNHNLKSNPAVMTNL